MDDEIQRGHGAVSRTRGPEGTRAGSLRVLSMEYRVWGMLVGQLARTRPSVATRCVGKVGRSWLSEPAGGSQMFIGERTARRAVLT